MFRFECFLAHPSDLRTDGAPKVGRMEAFPLGHPSNLLTSSYLFCDALMRTHAHAHACRCHPYRSDEVRRLDGPSTDAAYSRPTLRPTCKGVRRMNVLLLLTHAEAAALMARGLVVPEGAFIDPVLIHNAPAALQ